VADSNKPKIKVTENGPYLVSGDVPVSVQKIECDAEGNSLAWSSGEKFPAKQSCALCRCGGSHNKPYCDGTHAINNFNGTETANNVPYKQKAETIEGPELTLTDCEELCVGAAFCDRAGSIWNLVPESDNPEAKKIAIQEGKNCPSGRLVVHDKQGKAIEPDYKPEIGLMVNPSAGVNGPLVVRGGIPVESAEGKQYEVRNRMTLCRCGRSKNKPFCDGSHAGWNP
jgi:CDGSH-type Zn-finger protein